MSLWKPAFISLLFVIAATTTIIILSYNISSGESLLQPDDVPLITAGEKIYAENCASCHGNKLQGEPNWRSPKPSGLMPAPPHDQTGHTWHHSDDVLFGITKYGLAKFAGIDNYKTDMPTYENILTDGEIISVLSWIKSRWPQEIRARHDKLNATQVK